MADYDNYFVGGAALRQTLEDLKSDQDRQDSTIAAQQAVLEQAVSDIENHNKRITALENGSGGQSVIEGYLRISGSSDPALSYRHYAPQEGVATESVFTILRPCLVGNTLSGDIGLVRYELKKFGARLATAEDEDFTEEQAVWDDTDGNPHAIDGSEGEVMVCNTVSYYRIMGHYTIDDVELDVFLCSRGYFEWNGIEAEEVTPRGVSPDYTVAHKDTDDVTRMHSVYNPSWAGSYTAPAGVVGKYIITEDEETGELVETYDESATLLGGSGGLHTSSIALYTGEQYAMNNNPNTASCVPYMNSTAASVEDWLVMMLAEGGTFDAHKPALMGSGFCSNDPATSASDWEESGNLAKNGIRIYDKDGAAKMYSPSASAKSTIGLTGSSGNYFGTIVNTYCNPFRIMEAHRAVSYAVLNGIGELQWFAYEGNRYKYRSVDGFLGPQDGEMTCVVWKMLSSKLGSGCVDPTDKETSIVGNRIDLLFSVCLYHGITTQVSPSWWTSGLIFTEDENGTYEAYVQRDQASLIISEDGTKGEDDTFNFEEQYNHVLSISNVVGYRKNYHSDCLFLPDTNANRTGGGFHAYVGAYNWYNGSKPGTGMRAVRGFRRGSYVYYTNLSSLVLYGYYAPSRANTSYAFGTCVRLLKS